jgi:hypothetical protein
MVGPVTAVRNYVKTPGQGSGHVDVKTVFPQATFEYRANWQKVDAETAVYSIDLGGLLILGNSHCVTESICYDITSYPHGLQGTPEVRYGIEKLSIDSDSKFTVDGRGLDLNGQVLYSYTIAFTKK